MTEIDTQTTSFGFREIPAAEKEPLVKAVFDSVAGNYDLMNDLMSVGIHRVWKQVLLDRINPQPGQYLLDVAGGTGDVAFGFLKRASERGLAERVPARAMVCDINHAMLHAGTKRPEKNDLGHRAEFSCGNAEKLPFVDNLFDTYTISFGIRNVTNVEAALREAFRVLKPGGSFYCLEFSHPITDGLQSVYDKYSFNVIPWLGERVTNDRDSYEYLVESIRRFPSQQHFRSMIAEAGFFGTKFENLTAGVAAIHTGWKV